MHAGWSPGPADRGRGRLPATGAVHRERRARDSGGGGACAHGHHRRARARRAADAPRQRAAREEADRQPAVGASRCCGRASATATSTPRCSWRWRGRWAFRRASRSASSRCAARSTTTRGPRCTWTRARAAGCGCRSIRRSTSFPPTPRTSGWRAAGSTSRSAILPLIGRVKMTILDLELVPGASTVTVGREPTDMTPLVRCRLPQRQRGGCWAMARARGLQVIAVSESRQALRHVHRRRRREPRGEAGPDSRLSRPERRRQDHHHPHDRRPAEADRRAHPGQRPRPGRLARSRQGLAGLHSGSALHLREAHRRRVPALSRRAVRHRRRRHRRPHPRDARAVRAGPLAATSWSRASRTA